PAAGYRVLLIPDNNNPTTARHALNIPAVTDEQGKFRLTGVPAGVFTLTVAAAAYVFPNSGRSTSPGKTVILQEGEEVNDVDLALTRGGIITGRVLDANGQPVIGERVSVQVLDEKNRKRTVVLPHQAGETDDRGIYRLYGLPAGRYLVSIGRRPMPDSIKAGPGGTAPVTYYPGVVDEAKATPVSIQTNDEVENIDIKLGRATDTYRVSGRVVDAETGRPVPNINCGYTELTARPLPGLSPACQTNADGLFRLERIPPGRYALFISSDSNSEFYSEPTPFEVSSGDVQGLEIRARRGASISGMAVVEGVKDPAILSKLSQLMVYVTQPDKLSANPAAKT
ncbi:MAG TPA: carboxypeptidase regulatory-like domain-containing protein, partial [Candidatus Polarisedimenticolaceae bacterium]|nr:carboxypeptidase regulatory-like domain-containing protein [Candidatus Polarisedimenticolaceae bacterium]